MLKSFAPESDTVEQSASTVTLSLKATSPVRNDNKSASNKAAAARPKYRVLIIEDDPHIARLISVNLDRAGLEARIAYDGGAGLEAFREHPPHLVLLDLMMPVMDGFQVCEKIRSHSSVPVIIMTARLEPIHQMRGFRLGADDYVLKPFDPQLLVARVIAHLRRVYRYDSGHIHRKDTPASDDRVDGTLIPRNGRDPRLSTRDQQERCKDVLSHMPEGWAGCSACNYMGPLTQFPRRFNGHDSDALTCPHCQLQGFIKFSVN